MYRSSRYINKNDGQHNFFGEGDYIDSQDGKVIDNLEDLDDSPDEENEEISN